jgi:hypothetical protein
MAGRRLLVFIVLLLVVAAVASAVAPRKEDLAVRPVTPAAAPGLAAQVVQAVLPADKRVRARVGDVVQIEVTHGTQDEVQILGLGLAEPVEPGMPAQLVFDADRAGHFPVTLRDAATRLGTVEVRPAG